MNKADAAGVLSTIPLNELESICSRVREDLAGKRVDLCAIISARSGACSEDCAFCAQARSGGSDMVELADLTRAHRSATGSGINRFSAVTSGKGSSADDFQRICRMAEKGSDLCPLCASLGILDKEQLEKLRESGITRYHHNLETSREYFPKICSSHTWDERAVTVRRAKSVGLEVCSGGIMGIGETDEDRIDLAFSLAELEVDSIALNFFVPAGGVRISPERLSPEKMLRIIALFRLSNPGSEVRVCAGRSGFEDSEGKIFGFGATGIMTGTLLTTGGSSLEHDMEVISSAGYAT